MRLFLPTLLLVTILSGTAGASSFVAFHPVGTPISPSIIFLGTPKQAAAMPPAAEAGLVALAAPLPASLTPDLAGAAKPDAGSTPTVHVSPSIIALGVHQAALDLARSAAIGKSTNRGRRALNQLPMTIRGGIIGDAFTRGTGAQAPAETATNGPAEASASSAAPGKPTPGETPTPEKPPALRPPALQPR